MSDEAPRPHKPAVDPNDPVVTLRRPGGPPIALTLSEYRLALIGLVDFRSDWAGLLAAAEFVADGPAKRSLVQERLLPVSEHLDALLGRGVDSLELLAARHWFRDGRF